MLNRPLPAPARDIALLIGRILLGTVLFAHGWQKLVINGIAGTYGQFEKMGIPLAIVSAPFVAVVELVGGVLLVVGVFTTAVAALNVIVMIGAVGFVHITRGIFAANGGWELAGVIVACGLALAAMGPGAFSLDHVLAARRTKAQTSLARPPQAHRAISGTGTFAASVRERPSRAPQHLGISVTRAHNS